MHNGLKVNTIKIYFISLMVSLVIGSAIFLFDYRNIILAIIIGGLSGLINFGLTWGQIGTEARIYFDKLVKDALK